MARKRGALDQGAACLGFVGGLLLGAAAAITRISKRGATRRKDLRAFGSASLELEADESIQRAKAAARDRQRSGD